MKINDVIAGVGFNTSQHDFPSNDLFDRSGNMLHVSNNQQTLSMILSATKIPKEVSTHTSDELDDRKIEEPMIKSKYWADQVVEYEENNEDPDMRYEEDGKEHMSKSWADQIEEEEGNDIDSNDSHGAACGGKYNSYQRTIIKYTKLIERCINKVEEGDAKRATVKPKCSSFRALQHHT